MKIILTFLKRISIIVFVLLFILIIFANTNLLDTVVQTLLNIPLHNTILITHDKTSRKKVFHIKYIKINLLNNSTGVIENCNLFIDINRLITKLNLSVIAHIENLKIFNHNNKNIIQGATLVKYELPLTTLKNYYTVQLSNIKVSNSTKFINLTFLLKYRKVSDTDKILTYNIIDSDTSYIKLTSTIHNNIIKTNGQLVNFSPTHLNDFKKLLKKSNLYKIIKKTKIQSGCINGNIKIDSEKATQNNIIFFKKIYGDFNVTDANAIYKDKINLQEFQFDVKLSKKFIKCTINNGYINKTLLGPNSKLLVNLNNPSEYLKSDSDIKFSANIVGPFTELFDNIPNFRKVCRQYNINSILSKGFVNSYIDGTISFKSKFNYSYRLYTKIRNMSFKIGKNKDITLDDAVVIFDKKYTYLQGVMHINNNITYINLIHDHRTKNIHTINIKFHIPSSNQNLLDILDIYVINGTVKLGLIFDLKNDRSMLISDLTEAVYYLPITGLTKKIYEPSIFETLSNNRFKNKKFHLMEKNNLFLIAENIQDKDKSINKLYKINNTLNLANGLIMNSNKSLFINFKGQILDTTLHNLIYYFYYQTKGKNNINIDLVFDQLCLDEGSIFKEFYCKLKCDNDKWIYGNIEGNVNKKIYSRIELQKKKSIDQWFIYCNNIGSLLQSGNYYHDMENGKLFIILDRSNIINLFYSDVLFKKFSIKDQVLLQNLIDFLTVNEINSSFLKKDSILKFKNIKSHFTFSGDLLNLLNLSIQSNQFDLTMEGTIDQGNTKAELTGEILPAVYGMNKLFRKMPQLRKALNSISKSRIAPIILYNYEFMKN